MYNTQEIARIALGCGYAEIDMLDQCRLDNIAELADYLQSEGVLDCNALLHEIFLQVVRNLDEYISKWKDDILEEAREDNSDEFAKDIEWLENYPNESLESTFYDYTNCLDSNVYIEHLAFLEKYAADGIEEANRQLGFTTLWEKDF